MTEAGTATGGPLRIRDYTRTAMATGLSARNVRELHERMEKVPAGSLFHHFWGGLLRSDPGLEEYGNDLAEWAAYRLDDRVLAERLALVDPRRFADMDGLRDHLCEILETRMEEVEGRATEARPDEAFHFVSDQLVIYDTGDVVDRPEALPGVLEELTDPSVFLHFVHPPGLGLSPDLAVSSWIRHFGSEYEPLVGALEDLDIFLTSSGELRGRIRALLEEHFDGGRP